MTDLLEFKENRVDRTFYIVGGLVYIVSFIVYFMTVQRSVPFWDCGEFIAASAGLGVPHPPGTPLFVIIGRLFALLPIVADVAFRINIISVICSAFTAMFSYMLAVKLIRYFFDGDTDSKISRWITYLAGAAGGFFVAFSETNWGNSVEAEVYAIAMALCVLMVLLTVYYFENRGSAMATRIMILVFYLALLGIGAALTAFLVVPICAINFVLTKDATRRDYLVLSGCVVLELLFIMLFSDGRGGPGMFFLATGGVLLALLAMLWRKIDWIIAFTLVCIFTVMLSFELFLVVAPVAFSILLLVALLHSSWDDLVKLGIFAALTAGTTFTLWLQYGLYVYLAFLAVALLVAIFAFKSLPQAKTWRTNWRTALGIMVIALIGFSVHLYLPIRSAQRPWMDENHPSRNYRTFISFLDRKQYGSESMVSRMFHRRGTWENQFFRHPHMGFWSYFEGQYSKEGGGFLIWFALGVIGMYTAIKKRVELGVPFMVLFLLCSAGLVLYMNFADGTKYDFQSGDAYLEVRDRDYFFTPAFIFFGISMGLGIAAALQWLRKYLQTAKPQFEGAVVYIGLAMALLPGVALATNFHVCDRSRNNLAVQYAKAILDSCDKDAVIFTSGDNDTFPLWGVQQAYNYRKDVRVLCLSLVNTDWYVEQMKNKYNVPLALTDEQILWNPPEDEERGYSRPSKPFHDRARGREVFMTPNMDNGRMVKVQDMIVDEVVIENKWKYPIFFSAAPYAESPLKLREHATDIGITKRVDPEPKPGLIDVDRSYDLFMNTYKLSGMENAKVYRDENATGIFITIGVGSTRLFDELIKRGDRDRAVKLMNHMIEVYPEYWQSYYALCELYDKDNDSAKSDHLLQQLHDTLTAFLATSPDNQVYMEDLGMVKAELGRRRKDPGMVDRGLALMKEGFELNANNGYAFRKYAQTLYQNGRFNDLQTAARMYSNYKINLGDPYVQRILGVSPPPGGIIDDN